MKAANAAGTLVWAVALLGAASASEALTPYHEVYNSGIRSYRTLYAVSGSWHATCTEQTTGRGTGTRWCELAQVTGGRHRHTGVRETSGSSVEVQLWHHSGDAPRLSIEPEYRPYRNSTVAVTVGGKTFEKVMDPSRPKEGEWSGSVATDIVEAMLSGDSIDHNYVDGARGRRRGSVPLNGFGDVWAYAVSFVGFDPLLH